MQLRVVLLAIALLLFSSAATFADGPFGVTMGTAITEHKTCQSATGSPGFYVCNTLPRTHPDMQSYVIQSWPETGICFVKGIGLPISSDVYGETLRSKADDIAAQIKETYGNSQKNDYLMSGSIWKDSRDWSMALLKKERVYAYKWANETGAKLKDSVVQIFVVASALSSDRGYISVEFYFQNEKECQAAERKAKAKAF